jgi:cardiolipin synthase (CMP-forming)
VADPRETRDGARVFTLPNLLSFARLAGVPLFLWLVLGPKADGWAIIVLGLSGFSDWLDGQLARRLGQVSALGKLLDPFADRLYILAVLVGLALREVIPLWLAVLIPLRDVLLFGLILVLRRRGHGTLPVHFLGKAATFNLLCGFPLLLLGEGDSFVSQLAHALGWAFAIWGTALYYWAAVLYVGQVRQVVRTPQEASA